MLYVGEIPSYPPRPSQLPYMGSNKDIAFH